MSVNIYNSNPNATSEEENFSRVADRGSKLASDTIYSNTTSGLNSVNVQGAIDEVNGKVEDNANAISQINSNLFDNMTELSTDILATSNTSMSYPSNTKIISIAEGIRGKYSGLPYIISKAKISEFTGSKTVGCGQNEGFITFEITTTGITISNASNASVLLTVKCFG